MFPKRKDFDSHRLPPEPALARLAAPQWLAPGAMVSVETARDEAVGQTRLSLEAERVHGKAKLTLLRVDS